MRLLLLFLLATSWATSFILPLKLAAVVNQTEQAEVLTQHKNAWTTTVIVGTPGKAFTVQIDTNSGVLWVLDVASNTTTHPTYDQRQSSTYNNFTDSTFMLDMVQQGMYYGLARGPIGMDTVILGESFASNTARTSITVPNATFGQSVELPWYLPDYVDGVFGLGFAYENPSKDLQTVFQTAINQGDVKQGTFVIWLEDLWESSDNGTQGVIYYGNDDNLHCQAAQKHMYPIIAAWNWMFRVPTVTSTVPNKSPVKITKQFTAYIDSTSPYISIPIVQFDKIMTQLGINKNKQFPTTVSCDLKIDLAFNMPSGVEHVTERNLVVKKTDGTCQLQLIDTNYERFGDGNNYYNLGTPFLRGRCTFFDQAKQMVGFSQPLTHVNH